MPPRRNFGNTWWGGAWTDALEQRARLDPNRLPRGRTYARQARAGTLHAAPGQVTALVQGSRATPYSVVVHVREFRDDEWTRVLDVMAERAAHAAALLDGELPPGIVADLEAHDLDLLPIAGEVSTMCSCPDWADPCKHAAAVCYLIAELMDEDPFTLFLLRGLPREAVLGGIRARRRATTRAGRSVAGSVISRVPRAAQRDQPVAVTARAAWKGVGDEHEQINRLAEVGRPPLPQVPGTPAALALDPPTASGLTRSGLGALAADAANRAWAVLASGARSGLELTRPQDLARRAAAVAGTPGLDDLAHRGAVPARRLAAHAAAWDFGGAEGVDLTDSTWAPPAEALARARQVLAEFGVTARVHDNRVSAGDFQLRLGRSGLWYRFERHGGAWELAAPPDSDPGELLLAD